MGIYIKGMEMPPVGTGKVIMIDSDGDVWAAGKDECTIIDGAKAVPVREHGDLIDRDKFRKTMFIGEQCLYSWDEIEDAIDFAPTVIPACPQEEEI